MIDIKIDEKKLLDAMAKSPTIMKRHINRGLSRAGLEVARKAKELAPKSFSTLIHSIRSSRISPFEYHVEQGVYYGLFVEQGVKKGKMPNPDALVPWLQSKTQIHGPELRRRAGGLARFIQQHGVKAQPYMKPAAEQMESRVNQILDDSIDAGLEEAGLK